MALIKEALKRLIDALKRDFPLDKSLHFIAGALIGIIAAPWMLGQVIGGIIGASLLASLSASWVRLFLIVILLSSSAKLIVRGFEALTNINIPFF